MSQNLLNSTSPLGDFSCQPRTLGHPETRTFFLPGRPPRHPLLHLPSHGRGEYQRLQRSYPPDQIERSALAQQMITERSCICRVQGQQSATMRYKMSFLPSNFGLLFEILPVSIFPKKRLHFFKGTAVRPAQGTLLAAALRQAFEVPK